MKKNLILAALLFAGFVHAAPEPSQQISGKLEANTGGLNGVSELSDEMVEGQVLRIDEWSAERAKNCFEAFPNGTMPLVYSKKVFDNTIMICNSAYVTTVNAETKTPVYSAEYLNRPMITLSAQLEEIKPKEVDYKRDSRLPENYQVLIDDYNQLLPSDSLYKMTSLTPPDTQTTELEQRATLNLSNIAPVNRKLSEGLLTRINNGIKKFIYEQGREGYIVTGTFYEGSTYRIGSLKGAAVPTYIYKAFYFPTLGMASAYWIRNDEVDKFDIISIAELQKRIKVDLFPDIPSNIKNKIVYPPRPYGGDNSYLGDLKRLEDLNIDDFLQEKQKNESELKTINQ